MSSYADTTPLLPVSMNSNLRGAKSQPLSPMASGMLGVGAGIFITYIILLIASKGRLNSIFTSDSMACGAVKEMQRRNPSIIPNVTSLYENGDLAATSMQGCSRPDVFQWSTRRYTLDKLTGKYTFVFKDAT